MNCVYASLYTSHNIVQIQIIKLYMSAKPYSQIEFIPNALYDLKGKNTIVFVGVKFLRKDYATGDMVFIGGEWHNEEDNPPFKWHLPLVEIIYSNTDMQGFTVKTP